MLLIEEVKMLRDNLERIEDLTVETPVRGGSVDSVYEFIKYMALARNIFAKIEDCENNEITRSIVGKNIRNEATNRNVNVKEILSRIIHGAYINKSEKSLHVINDRGEEYLISMEKFIDVLDTLCLKDQEAILIFL